MRGQKDQQIRKALEEAAKLGKTDDVAEALESFPTIKHYRTHDELEAHYEHLKEQEKDWDCAKRGSRDVKADSISLHTALWSSSENGHPNVVKMVFPYFMYLTARLDRRDFVIEQAFIKSSANNHTDVINLVLPHYMDSHRQKVFKEKTLQTVLENSSQKGFSHIVESVLVWFKEPHVSPHMRHAGIKHAFAKSLSNRHHEVVKVLLPLFERLNMNVPDKIAIMYDAINACWSFRDQTLYRLICPIFIAFSLSEHREHLALYQQVEKSLNYIHEEIGSGVIPEQMESKVPQMFTSKAIHDISVRIEHLKKHAHELRFGNGDVYMQAHTIERRNAALEKEEIEFASEALCDGVQSRKENTLASDILRLISWSQGYGGVWDCLKAALCIASKYGHKRTLAGLLSLMHDRIEDIEDRSCILRDPLNIAFQNHSLAVIKLLVPECLECYGTPEDRSQKMLRILHASKIDGHPDIVTLLPKVFPHHSYHGRSHFLSEALTLSASNGHMKTLVSLLHEFSTSAQSYEVWKAGLDEAKATALFKTEQAEHECTEITQEIEFALHEHHESSTSAHHDEAREAGRAEAREQALSGARAVRHRYSAIHQQIEHALDYHLYCERQILLRRQWLERADQQRSEDLEAPQFSPCAKCDVSI